MNWGPIILGAVVFAIVLLLVLALRKMRAKKRYEEPEGTAEPEERLAEPEEAEALKREPEAVEAAIPPKEPPPSGKAARKAKDRVEEKKRLTVGLAKTRGGFITRLGGLFRGTVELDDQVIDQIEEILFTADIGVQTSQEILDDLRKRLGKREISDPNAIWQRIKIHTAEILKQQEAPPLDPTRSKPYVILVVGVNGTGKTTTIGKLAARLGEEGYQVILAAGDTFRAAAVEQLEIWGNRANCQVVKGKEGADPTSVMIDALNLAKERGADIVIGDTAGRLHTKIDLMDEIKKVRRSLSKRVEGAPHEVFLVLDATMGQNAISQAKIFKDALNITGIILTKLDGTAKGGVVLGITNELRIPVRFIGIGEKVDDLREFDAEAFIEALYQDSEKIIAEGPAESISESISERL
jgi:fused signal recognition particle receptor